MFKKDYANFEVYAFKRHIYSNISGEVIPVEGLLSKTV